jgi:hypothetical protein
MASPRTFKAVDSSHPWPQFLTPGAQRSAVYVFAVSSTELSLCEIVSGKVRTHRRVEAKAD